MKPVRVDRFVTALAGQISRRDLRADLGNGVVEFDQPALIIRQAGADHGHGGRVVQVSHGSVLRWGWAPPRLSRGQGDAGSQPFLFQGADAILGGVAGVAGAAGAGFAVRAIAAAPFSGGR